MTFGKRRGGTLVIVAASFALLMGTAASVVDLGAALQSRTRQQVADDAAAMAAASAYADRSSLADAAAAAIDWGARNGVTIVASGVTLQTQPDGSTSLVVASRENVPTVFARTLGVNTLPVSASSAATLRGVSELPTGTVPIGVPAYQDPGGNYHVLSTPDGPYVTPTTKNPPTIDLKPPSSGGCGDHHSCVPLTMNGGCHDDYEQCVVHGCSHALGFDTCQARCDHAACAESTCQRVQERCSNSCAGTKMVVPLVSKDDFDRGCDTPKVIGCMGVQVTSVGCDGTIHAKFQPVVVNAHTCHSGTPCQSVGVCAPTLCGGRG